MKKLVLWVAMPLLGYAGQSHALSGGCPVDDNWVNRITSETYTYQQYTDNPIQNIAGDSLALNFDGLGVYSDGLVKDGDQVRFTLTNGASFADNPSFPGVTPKFVLEEDLGGAGTGDLTVATLVESNPVGGDTLTFNLIPANFDGYVFDAPPDPCVSFDNYSRGEGVILSGANIAGQATNYAFAPEPWGAQDVVLQIDYLRSGTRLFGGEVVLFSVSDYTIADADGDGIPNVEDPFPLSDTTEQDNGVTLTITPSSSDSACTITSLTGASIATSYPNIATQGVGVSAGFTLSSCDTGSAESVDVSIDLGATPASGAVAYKVATSGEWQAIPGATIVGSVLSYTIVDNGPLDQNPVLGTIEDPVTAGIPIVDGPVTAVPALPLFGLLSLGGLLGLFGLRKLSSNKCQ